MESAWWQNSRIDVTVNEEASKYTDLKRIWRALISVTEMTWTGPLACLCLSSVCKWIRVRVFDPEYFSLPVFYYHQMIVESRVKIHFVSNNMAYAYENLFILIYPGRGFNLNLWGHKLSCYQLSHPFLFTLIFQKHSTKIYKLFYS